MESTINERISVLVEKLSRNQSDFARLSKISTQTLSSILTRGSKPGAEILESIILAFPQIDPLWLVCGIGEMQRNLTVIPEEQKEFLGVLKRENEILIKNNDSLIKDKERLWEMVADLRKKIEANEYPQIEEMPRYKLGQEFLQIA